MASSVFSIPSLSRSETEMIFMHIKVQPSGTDPGCTTTLLLGKPSSHSHANACFQVLETMLRALSRQDLLTTIRFLSLDFEGILVSSNICTAMRLIVDRIEELNPHILEPVRRDDNDLTLTYGICRITAHNFFAVTHARHSPPSS